MDLMLNVISCGVLSVRVVRIEAVPIAEATFWPIVAAIPDLGRLFSRKQDGFTNAMFGKTAIA